MIIKRINNFLPEDKFNLLKKYFEGSEVNWNFYSSSLDDDLLDDNYLFSCIVDNDEAKSNPNWIFFLSLLREHIGEFELSRIKANIYPNQNKQVQHAFHCDPKNDDGSIPDDFITCVYNLTTCNGYTIVGDTKISSVENEMIVFPANTLHCGAVQTDTKTRVVFNINVKVINI